MKGEDMITPIITMTINQIAERKYDLLFSNDDIKEMARNVRAKSIDEFAELMKERLKDIQFAEFQGIDVCPCYKTGEECPYINQDDIGCQYCAREQTVKDIDRIAEQLKAGEKE